VGLARTAESFEGNSGTLAVGETGIGGRGGLRGEDGNSLGI
jgi:hypothetical protein